VEWCDITVWNIYCPACDEVVEKKTERHKRGDEMTCPHCGHDWRLRLWSEDSDEDDTEIDLCCDGQCTWDRPQEEVEAWCARIAEAEKDRNE
jgi:hypothetical protein